MEIVWQLIYTLAAVTAGCFLGYRFRCADLRTWKSRAQQAEVAYREVLRRIDEERKQRQGRVRPKYTETRYIRQGMARIADGLAEAEVQG